MPVHLAFTAVLALLAGAPTAAGAGALFKFQGKEIRTRDLTPAERQALYEIELEHVRAVEGLADQAILSRYLDAKAKQAGRTRPEIEAELLATTEATDKEAEVWFNENKSRLPPHLAFDQVKGEIKSHLRDEELRQKKLELVRVAKQESGAVLLIPRPEAPVVQIATGDYPTRGAKNAKVRLVEFADYQCPHCAAAGAVIDRLLKKYAGDLSLTYIDYPINPSGVSLVVAHGAVCADIQGKYWEYHDRAFAEQRALSKESPSAFAKDLQLDEVKFNACLESPAPKQRVEAGRSEGDRLGVNGTPAIFVNGRRVMGYDEAALTQAVERLVKGKSSEE